MSRSLFCACLGAGLALCQAASAQVVRPLPVPGRVQAEDYDTNGPGVSYFDTTAGNSGGVYRTDDVDIEVTQDAGGGYDVGWIASGEWLNYTLNVQETAVYSLAFRLASAGGAGELQVSIDGLPLCSVPTPATGGWQNWQTVTISNLVLRSGQRLLHLDFQTGGCNLNYVQISRQGNLSGAFLRASGEQIVDGDGRNVILRGMGLGNWMLQEPYMMNASGLVANQQELKAKILDLVGAENMATFYDAWLTNYIREDDVQFLAESGFNSIRLPMHYALLTLPVDQEPVPGENTFLESGFKLIDDLLGWCETNHVYLILDMHACPGGQGHDQAISDYNPAAPSLWESAANQAKLVALWHEIARRYATNAWIGGYDLINEPNWSFEGSTNVNGCSDQTNAPLRQLLVQITAAIREVDTNHILFLEGNCWGGNYQGLLPPWDPNLVISFHKYWDAPTAESLQPWINMREQWDMPLWLGESGENSDEWFRDVVRYAEQANIGWSWWPWKKLSGIAGTVTVSVPAGYQNILDYWASNGPRPTTNAAFNALMNLAQAVRFENCLVHPDVLDALLRPNTGGETLAFGSNTVPGLVFAADYDLGASGDAYFDTTTNSPYNSGQVYRNDSVDIETCSDAAPSIGYDVGWIDPGDWMKYTVAPAGPGPYAVTARVAGGNSGGSFYLDVGGTNVTGVIAVPATGGWQSWATISAGTITNRQPPSSFKLVAVSAGFNLNWVRFQSLAPARPVNLSAAAGLSEVQLQWDAVAGATAYNVKRSTNSGGPYTVIVGAAGTHYADTMVVNGTAYFYVVSAVNGSGESWDSAEAGATPYGAPRLSARLVANGTALELSWPLWATNFTLYAASNLDLPIWLPVASGATNQAGLWILPLPEEGGNRFFRLATQ